MKPLFFLLVFLFLGKSFGEATSPTSRRCVDLFPAQPSPALRNAILKGIRIFDAHLDPYEQFENVFIHGTTVQNVQRSTGTHFLGSPIENFDHLNRLFSTVYQSHMVLFAFYQGSTPVSADTSNYVEMFAEQAALKFYLLQALNMPEFYEPRFIDELNELDYLSDADHLKDLLLEIVRDTFDPSLADDLSARISGMTFDFLFRKMTSRRGVILFIDGRARTAFPVEQDPDFMNSNALISSAGIPWEYINAVVPQTKTERDELARLLQP